MTVPDMTQRRRKNPPANSNAGLVQTAWRFGPMHLISGGRGNVIPPRRAVATLPAAAAPYAISVPDSA
eukprot:3730182-Rhodomonas_salina.3